MALASCDGIGPSDSASVTLKSIQHMPSAATTIVIANGEYDELDDLPASTPSDIELSASSVSPVGVYGEGMNSFVLSLTSESMATLTDDLELTLFTSGEATRIEHLFAYNRSENTLSVIPEGLAEFRQTLRAGRNELVISATDDKGLPLSFTIVFWIGVHDE